MSATAENPERRRSALISLTNFTTRTRSKFREIRAILHRLRAPILVSLIGVIALSAPGQTHEIYWVFAEDLNIDTLFTGANIRFAIFLGMLWGVGYVLWYISRILTLTHDVSYAALFEDDFDGVVARWAPRIIGAAPSIAAGVGMIISGVGQQLLLDPDSDALVDIPEGQAITFLDRINIEVIVLYGAAMVAFALGALRIYWSWNRTRRMLAEYRVEREAEHVAAGATSGAPSAKEAADRAKLAPPPPGVIDRYAAAKGIMFRKGVRWALAAASFGMIVFLMTQPIAFSQSVGALSILGFFMIALACGLTVLSYTADRWAIPGFWLLLGGAVLWSWFDLNDNHYARRMPVEAQPAQATAGVWPGDTDVQTAFRAWLDSRRDRDAYDAVGQPYPVYVIAAQGGGLYAAYQSAIFLARIQDACPNFAQHIFGLSGVSGGAVGATVFTSLAMRYGLNTPASEDPTQPCGASTIDPENSIERRTRDMLSQDFLSPLVTALAFSDFTARFSPAPIPVFSRARALERAFEDAWARTGDDRLSPLTEGLLSSWSPTAATPALFINTTEADSGRRMILSPIRDLGPELRSFADLAAPPQLDDPLSAPSYADGALAPLDMPLSTAMILSARFPYVTPAGSIDLVEQLVDDGPDVRRKVRLVDGGYFENSGIATAADIVRQIEPIAEQENVDLRLIVFDLTRDAVAEPSYSLGELMSPIKAMLNVRTARSGSVQMVARRDYTTPTNASQCRYLLLGGSMPWSRDEACPPSQVQSSRIWSVSLDDFEFDFQLGWILSQVTLTRIDRQLGDPAECRLGVRSLGDGLSAGGAYDDDDRERTRSLEAAEKAQTRAGDGTVLRENEAIWLTRTQRAIERHNSCIGQFIVRQLSRQR